MIALFALMFSSAWAGSLDLLEVGGAWGTPAATNPTAIWWNPAGMAVGGGTQFIIEGAPVFATVNYDRTNPDYGPAGDLDENGDPLALDQPYDFSGSEQIKFNGVVPFVGVQTDLTVPGLAIGAGLAVPFALGGTVGDPAPSFDQLSKATAEQVPGLYPESPGSFFLRDGSIQAIYAMFGAGYHIADKVAVGASVSMVDSTWYAVTDVETLSTLEQNAGALADYSQTEQLFEDPNYRSTLHFDHLRDRAFTFGAGLYATPVDGLGISVAYNHGMRLEHTGDVMVTTGCPPEEDTLGRLGVEALGLCNATTPGRSTVSYSLPSRINAGVVYDGIDRLRLEAMGGWVGWHVFTDYEIQTRIDPEDVPDANNPEAAAGLITQDRLWARDAKDSFWLGVDGKGEVVPGKLTLGGRVIFDKAAIPDAAVATNNYDADRINLGAVAAVGPFKGIQVAASFGQQILFERTVTDSAFAASLGEDRKEDRYFYPSANGTYGGGISRVGVSVMGAFGGRADE